MRSDHSKSKIAFRVRGKFVRVIDAVLARFFTAQVLRRHLDRNQIAFTDLIHDRSINDVLSKITKGDLLNRRRFGRLDFNRSGWDRRRVDFVDRSVLVFDHEHVSKLRFDIESRTGFDLLF